MAAYAMCERHSVTINTHVSDIFFNMDHDEAKIKDGCGLHYDPAALLRTAIFLHDRLESLGVSSGDPVDLVNDFLARL